MKKSLFLCFFVIIFAISSWAQRVIDFQEHSVELRRHVAAKDISMPVVKSFVNGNNIVRSYSIKNALVTDLTVNNESFAFLHIRGFGVEAETGVPQLPGTTDIIPVNGEPILTVMSSGYVEYDGYDILPAQRILDGRDTLCTDLREKESVYGEDSFYPKDVVTLQGVLDYKDRKFAVVRINPIQYNPVRGLIRCYHSLTYSLGNFSALDIDTQLPYVLSTKQEKYIVVTNDACLQSVSDFVEWKKALGFHVSVISKEKWADDTEVRDSIRKEYWKDTTSYDSRFLLIAGGVTVVPSHNVRSKSNNLSTEPHYATDHLFACMGDDDDQIEDIARGRIPVGTPEDLKHVLDFIVSTERERTFWGRGVHGAFFNSYDGKTEMLNCVSFSEDIRDFMMRHGFDVTRVYSTDKKTSPLRYSPTYANGDSVSSELRRPYYDWNGSAAEVLKSLSNGCDYVLYKGHGIEKGLYQIGFTIDNIPAIPNGACNPAFLCFSCLGGHFANVPSYWKQGTENRCFSTEMLLQHKSPALIASSGVCNAPYLEPFGEGVMSCLFRDSILSPQLGVYGYTQIHGYNSSPSLKIGDMMKYGLEKMLVNYGMTKDVLEEQCHYHVLGDPSYDFSADSLVNLNNVKIFRGGDSLYIKTGDITDVSVILMKNGEAGETLSYKRVCPLLPFIAMADTTSYNKVIVLRGNSVPVVYEHGIPVVYLQNKVVEKGKEMDVIGEEIYMGNDVLEREQFGDVVVMEGSMLSVRGHKKVSIKRGFRCSKGGKLKVCK